MKKLLLLSIFFAPIGAQLFSVEIGGIKLSLFRTTMILILFAFVASNINGRKQICLFTKETKYSVSFMMIWFFYALFTVIWSNDLGNYVRVLFFMFIACISIILLINYFKTVDDIVAGFQAFVYGIFVQSIIGWYEIFTRDYRFIEYNDTNIRIYINSSQRIPIAATGNPNNFATLMFFGVFIAYTCFYYSKKHKVRKLFNLLMCGNFLILLVLTTSRANILGLLLALVFLLFMSGKVKQMVLIITGAILFSIPKVTAFIAEHLRFNFDISGASESIRVNLIKNGFIYLLETFGFGVGNGQIEYWNKNRAVFNVWGITNMHNWWMEILTSYGVFIFVGYLIFYLRIFFENYRNAKNINSYSREVSLNIAAILAGFVITSISSSSNMTNEWIWMFFALCIAFQAISKKGINDRAILN